MTLAKLPITITRTPGDFVIKTSIPKSQVKLMNEWLEENNYSTWASDCPALAREIEKRYPGGLQSWSDDAEYPIEFQVES